MTALRGLVGALGLAAAAFGAVQLLDLGWDNLVAAGTWLVAGVVLHDGVLAPVTIAVGLLTTMVWCRLPAPVVVGAVVLATVTVTAVPVLGRFGARPDNSTLLDRNYVLGWLGVATLTVVLVGATSLWTTRTRKDGADGTGTGRR